MTTSAVLAASAAGGFSWKTLLTFVGAAILLAFFSSLGIIARIRDRRIEARREAQQAHERQQRAVLDHPDNAPGSSGG